LGGVDWSLVRLLVTKGIPMGLQMFVVSSSIVALTSLANRFGSQETAAFNAALQLWNYVQMPALAISGAVSSMAAQNVGARKWDRVGTVALSGVLWSFAFFGMSMVLFGVVRATGALMPPRCMLVTSLWCMRVPFAYLMLNYWQAEAIWWSFALASLTSLVMATGYYRFGGWRTVRMGVAEANAAPVANV
jgi:Na+-driven multidrug efflux pump